MDTEIRQNHPGSCPKCGMTLGPALPIGPGGWPSSMPRGEPLRNLRDRQASNPG